ncbi:E3 ubiquitin-protein ligase DZIP3-like [Ruditapes philippinarum]|uniref:E3 ubiquitin-protein ligase DZIP3-like n=1 Tax=Ruditapes philippinarum TaxID=129788 RepID=UPI00295B0C03|nr:E3 ubiquitin-protein ligase DZIP3-like [Ruditapes philippinarum]
MASGDPENRIHLFRLQILIIDGGLLVLRSILDQTIAAKGITLKTCLNNERSKITRLHGNNVITQDQYDLLFPMGGQEPTTADMDITLISCLLANLKCFGLNKKFKWNATPAETDLTVEADICRLRNFRNKICHMSTTTGIEQNEFTTLWNEIEQILIRQNTPALNMHQNTCRFQVVFS